MFRTMLTRSAFKAKIHNEATTNRQGDTAGQRAGMGVESPDGKAEDEIPIMRPFSFEIP